MKKRAATAALVAALLLTAALYLRRPALVPPGQQKLVTLSNANLGEFANAFDANSNVPRLVLLLSPT